MFFLSDKGENSWHELIRKEKKSFTDVAKIYKKESSTHAVEKGRTISTTCIITSQTARVVSVWWAPREDGKGTAQQAGGALGSGIQRRSGGTRGS